jgi:catabolite regulation protein CreA
MNNSPIKIVQRRQKKKKILGKLSLFWESIKTEKKYKKKRKSFIYIYIEMEIVTEMSLKTQFQKITILI